VKNRIRVVAALVAVIAVAVGVAVVLRARHPAAADRRRGGPRVKVAVAEVPPEPSVWVDVHAPDRVWRALRSNAWLDHAADAPLGRGFTAGWAGFLSTRGGDLAGAFEGTVLDVVLSRLLADPFRLVFYAGPDATGAPALVVSRPSPAAREAFDLLDATTRNGTYEAASCPGVKAAEGAPPALAVARWLVAEHAVFAGERDGRLAFAKNATAVIQALCAAPPDVPAAEGVDVSLSFSRDALGREAQLGAALLGLGPATRLAFAVEGDHLAPRGILGPLDAPGRLDAGPPPEALLRLVPADAGVVLIATLRLPEPLTRASLAEHLKGAYAGPTAARPVAVVWNPRGDPALPTEVAVAWPERDAALLREAFSGPNRLDHRHACGHEVYASTSALAASIARSCTAQRASLLNAAPAVVAGLRDPSSIALGVQLGGVLSRLLGDAAASDPAARKGAPEVDAARRLLEELPYVGLRGLARDGALVPGGFRS
jgi:hypothetical protein